MPQGTAHLPISCFDPCPAHLGAAGQADGALQAAHIRQLVHVPLDLLQPRLEPPRHCAEGGRAALAVQTRVTKGSQTQLHGRCMGHGQAHVLTRGKLTPPKWLAPSPPHSRLSQVALLQPMPARSMAASTSASGCSCSSRASIRRGTERSCGSSSSHPTRLAAASWHACSQPSAGGLACRERPSAAGCCCAAAATAAAAAAGVRLAHAARAASAAVLPGPAILPSTLSSRPSSLPSCLPLPGRPPRPQAPAPEYSALLLGCSSQAASRMDVHKLRRQALPPLGARVQQALQGQHLALKV